MLVIILHETLYSTYRGCAQNNAHQWICTYTFSSGVFRGALSLFGQNFFLARVKNKKTWFGPL